MSETPKDKDQEKGDELLRRLLKTPPKPHDDKGDNGTRKSDRPDARQEKPES